jgi:signal recognition particle GTPase
VIDGLLSDTQAKPERLLDLYLGGEVDKSFLTERKHRLEQTTQSLEQERAPVAATLEQRALANGQAATIDELIAKVANLLGTCELAFETKRRLLEALQTEVTLFTEDDRKRVSVLRVLGEDVLSVSGNTTSG